MKVAITLHIDPNSRHVEELIELVNQAFGKLTEKVEVHCAKTKAGLPFEPHPDPEVAKEYPDHQEPGEGFEVSLSIDNREDVRAGRIPKEQAQCCGSTWMLSDFVYSLGDTEASAKALYAAILEEHAEPVEGALPPGTAVTVAAGEDADNYKGAGVITHVEVDYYQVKCADGGTRSILPEELEEPE